MENGIFKGDETFLKEEKEEEKKEEHHILSYFYYNRRIREDFLKISKGSDETIGKQNSELQKSFLAEIKKRFDFVFGKKAEEFEELIEKLKLRNFSDDEEMLVQTISEIHKFANENFERKELEELKQKEKVDGEVYLNEYLFYDIDSNDSSVLEVHINPNSGKMTETIRDSIALLAEELKNNSGLKNITTILAYSWIIFKHPKIVERLGFTVLEVSEEDKKLGKQKAQISKEEFLAKYGTK